MNMKWRLWRRRLLWAIGLYFVFWIATWLWSPSAVDRCLRRTYTVGRSFGGEEAPISHFRNVNFSGEGLQFLPNVDPNSAKGVKWFCCTGRPWSPCPFVTVYDIAYVKGPLDGFGGTEYSLSIPWYIVP